MLDAPTRRRIDTARDILVGKVPDPKSQVEQITIALIYKFMWDIDAESEELGGERSFFVGEFNRYGWPRLMHAGLGGHATLNLYAEAITRMPENPGVPPLFRTIFNNAYLPYRDPETLRAFLKIIDEFEYDHSERLGDAFEYLLSVMGAQGDAGQFRTPRHIIDFIVAIIDPKKHETVLDPACGTAGFLISSYKHILAENVDEHGHDTLTPDERGRLAENFMGYDISPDMVRLSLVNLYLHGFADPRIHEYDTLTSDERWSQHADVILANPPFMSPKGGIRPHNRFSITSRRSEVLFVDYMAEHLTPAGRAGIIVPEGIIFQSQKAHTRLRQMLVDDSLVAVVSLPAGVFKPYSGVKTSILILDRALARRTDRIAFFKVDNDGFDLGDQRRPTDKNDLPQVQAELTEYLRRVRLGESLDDFQPSMGLIVEKERIATGDDYNLSGERYQVVDLKIGSFPLVRIGDVCVMNPRKSQLANLDPGLTVSFVPMADLNENQMTFNPSKVKVLSEVSASYTYFANGDVLLAKVTPCFENGKAGLALDLVNGIGFGSSEFYVLRSGEHALPEWVYFCVTHSQFRDSAVGQMTGTGGLQRVPRDFVEDFRIPLPPLEVQQEIAAEIEGYQRVIDGACAVIDNYRAHIPLDSSWPETTVDECCEVKGGKRLPKGEYFSETPTPHPYIRVSDFHNQSVNQSDLKFISDATRQQIARYTISSADVYISIAGTIGLMGTVPESLNGANLTENAAKLVPDSSRIDKRFLAIIGSTGLVQEQIRSLTHAVGVPKLALARIKILRIPIPPLGVQRAIAAEIDSEQDLVNTNRELIDRFERKIQAAIARVWDMDVPGSTKTSETKDHLEPLLARS